MKHAKVNGVWYDLAESAEGPAYQLTLQALRPPNSQIVQGGDGDFQLRPDLLKWTLSDWSEGEGQLKYDATQPGRSYQLQGVDPFTRPGNLQLGYLESFATDELDADLNEDAMRVVQGLGGVYMFATGQNIWRVWDHPNLRFGAEQTHITVAGGPAPGATLCGDANYIYWESAGDIMRFDGATATVLNDQYGWVSQDWQTLIEHGPYLYLFDTTNGQIFELSKDVANTATPETALYEFDSGIEQLFANNQVAGDNRVYFYTLLGMTTIVHEIVPTSAAGAGYGRELARLEGVRGEAIWFNGGTIFLLATDDEVVAATPVGPDRQIFYINPEGTLGTLGSVRGLVQAPSDHGIAAPPIQFNLSGAYAASGRLALTAFTTPPTSEDQDVDDVAGGLFEVDGVTGGYAAVGRYPTTITSRLLSENDLLYHKGLYFTVADNPDEKIIVFNTQKFTTQVGTATSPSHDFQIASEKILERIEVACEPLPASSNLTIGYSLDGAAWVDTSVVTVTGATGGELQISTDSTTKTFRNLRIRAIITPSGGVGPVVTAVDIFARVNRKMKVWDLLLDATDDAAPQGYNGAKLIENILGIADNTVIAYIDNYRSHDATDGGTEYDVLIDGAQIVLDQAGEGVLAVRLVEVLT